MTPDNLVYLGWWQDLVSGLPDGCVDLVLTDPPYKSTPSDWDRERPEWVPFMSEMARICGDKGQMWIFCRMPWACDVWSAACETGWRWVQERVWVKQNAGGCTAGLELRKIHETIWHFKRPGSRTFNQGAIREPKTTKGNKSVKRRNSSDTQFLGTENSEYVDDGLRMPKSVVFCRSVHRTSEATGHPTQKPVNVVLPLILYSSNPGDLVFDPYCGSGTTPVAAKMSGRRWIAAEKTPRWHAVASGRVEASGTVECLGSMPATKVAAGLFDE